VNEVVPMKRRPREVFEYEPSDNFDPDTGLFRYANVQGAQNLWVNRCVRIKRDGTQCKGYAQNDKLGKYCYKHNTKSRYMMGKQNGLKHGRRAKAYMEKISAEKAMISYLGDCMRMFDNPTALPRNLGNSPFKPFRTMAQVEAYLHSIGYREDIT